MANLIFIFCTLFSRYDKLKAEQEEEAKAQEIAKKKEQGTVYS